MLEDFERKKRNHKNKLKTKIKEKVRDRFGKSQKFKKEDQESQEHLLKYLKGIDD